MKTGSGMVEYARQYLGTPYFYGSKIPEGILTENKMEIMHAMYPGIVTDSYMAKARSRGQVGRVNVDCSGLIAGYRQKNIGSAQLYQTAYTRMPIARLSDFAPGVVLWRPGHVGVYAGNVEGIPMCIEAKGIRYGTVMTRVTVTSVTQARKKGIESYLSGGEGVKWLQWELAYQRSCKITADGLAGKTTRKYLSAA